MKKRLTELDATLLFNAAKDLKLFTCKQLLRPKKVLENPLTLIQLRVRISDSLEAWVRFVNFWAIIGLKLLWPWFGAVLSP